MKSGQIVVLKSSMLAIIFRLEVIVYFNPVGEYGK
jgi:hypothetical protein